MSHTFTSSEKLEKVREKIVEANPDILLSANHPIQNAIAKLAEKYDLSSMRLREIGLLVGIEDAHPQIIKHHLGMVLKRKKQGTIARPIRLSDVLLTIPDNHVEIRLSKPVVLLLNHEKHTDCQWNLQKDSLDQQSEECLNFLFSLLIDHD